jgi:hypothetical protein
MSTSIITVNNANVTLVSFPTSSGLRSFDVTINDPTSTVTSPYTGQTQVQAWPGGDMWSGTATLAPLTVAQADDWEAFLMQLRGMSFAFQMGDPLKQTPRGTPSGTPQVDNTQNGNNVAMSQSIGTKGWTASTGNLLLRGDYIQVGYRLHRVLDAVTSDSNGNAVISIWPSLREQPTDSSNVITTGTQGLWRLAGPQRTWSFDVTQLTRISFKFQEYR